jgi:hypothetical protein
MVTELRKELISMNQKTSDQKWQQLQAHIENYFGQSLRSDSYKSEYKPLLITQVPGIPSERHNEGQRAAK